MTTTIIIDNFSYSVPIKSMTVTPSPLEAAAERTRDGLLHVERIGVFDTYVLEIGRPINMDEVTELAALYLVISSVTVFHQVKIPGENGGAAWSAYFSGVRKEVNRRVNTTTFWKNLQFSIIPQGPTRT